MELEFDPDNVQPGTVIGGCAVVRRVGAGGFGTIFVVRTPTASELALKLCKIRLAEEPDAATRFKREMAALSILEHPNIVAVYGHGYHPSPESGYPYLLTELVVGARLDHYVRAVKPTLKQLVRLMLKIFRAVAHMHEHGVLHRDLKPSNIMVREADGEPVLIDFGLVAVDAGDTVTVRPLMLGTPSYLAPEYGDFYLTQAWLAGKRFDSTEAIDIYALGVTFYELLTGRRPHEKTPSGINDLFEAKRQVKPTRPDLVNTLVPAPLCDLVLALLSVDPIVRPSAVETATRLEAILSEAPEAWDAPWTMPTPRGPADGTVAARGRSRSGSESSSAPAVAPAPAPAATELPSLSEPADPFEGISVNVPSPVAPRQATPNVVVDAALSRRTPPSAVVPAASGPARFDDASVQRSFVSLVAPVPVDAAAERQREDLAALVATAKQLTAGEAPRRSVPAGVWVLGGLIVLILGFLAFVNATSPQAPATGGVVQMAAAGPLAPSAAGLVAAPVGPPPERPAEPASGGVSTKTTVREPQGGARAPHGRTKPAAASAPAVTSPVPAKGGNVDLFAGSAPAAAVAAQTVPAGVRCNVELRAAVTAADAPVPVSVIFRKPCFQFGEREVVPASSTASGVATGKGGRLLIQLTELRVVGGGTVKVNAEAMQAGLAGITGTRALRAPRPAGAEAVDTLGQVAQSAALSQLPAEAQQVIRSAKPTSQGAEQAVEMVALGRGEQFQILFREVVQQ